MFYFNVTIQTNYTLRVNQSRGYGEVKKVIIATITSKLKSYLRIFEIFNYVMMITAFLVFIRAWLYRRKYLTRDKLVHFIFWSQCQMNLTEKWQEVPQTTLARDQSSTVRSQNKACRFKCKTNFKSVTLSLLFFCRMNFVLCYRYTFECWIYRICIQRFIRISIFSVYLTEIIEIF